mgnify:CR=1 FL=1
MEFELFPAIWVDDSIDFLINLFRFLSSKANDEYQNCNDKHSKKVWFAVILLIYSLHLWFFHLTTSMLWRFCRAWRSWRRFGKFTPWLFLLVQKWSNVFNIFWIIIRLSCFAFGRGTSCPIGWVIRGEIGSTLSSMNY